MIVCPEIKQKQPQDRKTIFGTLSLPVSKILSPVTRQAPTKLTLVTGPTSYRRLVCLERFWPKFCLKHTLENSLAFTWGNKDHSGLAIWIRKWLQSCSSHTVWEPQFWPMVLGLDLPQNFIQVLPAHSPGKQSKPTHTEAMHRDLQT